MDFWKVELSGLDPSKKDISSMKSLKWVKFI
jgi:hypothetical protein